MRKSLKILVIFLLLSVDIIAQREASNWYFGAKAGLNFNQGSPIPNLNGQLDTTEGCESISNPDGVLLFYTDGITIWNREHQVMSNGEGLLGSFSSSQSALIIPKIDDPNIYYVFTADVVQAYTNNGQGNGLNYSVVDMSLNGGLGEVIEKNFNLLPQSSEKLTAVSAFDGTGYWLITHNTNRFYSYKVGTEGVSFSPIVSDIGPNIIGYNNIRGSLKSSPDGRKIAIAHCIFEPQFSGSVYLYDFNIETGEITNQEFIDDGYVFYGVEFSSNSSMLYTSGKVIDSETNTTNDIVLFQYDLNASNISASSFLIHTYQNTFLSDLAGALQIAIDRKIYHSIPKNQLSVIRTPNLPQLDSDFRDFEVDLGGRPTKFGLPPFIQSFFESIISVDNFCEASNTEFTIESDEIIQGVHWDFGDPMSGSNTSTLINPTHVFSSAGIYTVTLGVDFLNRPPKTFVEFVEISEIPFAIENVALTQCDDDILSDGISIFNLNEVLSFSNQVGVNLTANYFLTLNDAQNNENAIVDEVGYQNTSNGQVIYARVFENAECYSISEVTLNVEPHSNLGTYDVYDICSDEIGLAVLIEIDQILNPLSVDFPNTDISIYRSEYSALLKIEPLTEDFYITFTQAFEVYFRVETENLCNYIGKIDLDILVAPVVEDIDYVYCPAYQNTLDAGAGFETYLWSTGEVSQTIDISEPGIYSVEVSNGICLNDFVVNAVLSSDIEIESISVNDFQESNTVEIFVNEPGEGLIEYSLDGITYFESNYFNNVQPGLYTVRVKRDNCGLATKTILVGGFPKFFTPNGDGQNDTWQIKSRELFEPAIIEIYDRYGKLLKTMDSLSEGWNGTFNGQLVIPSDYWFIIKFRDRQITGHFAMKL